MNKENEGEKVWSVIVVDDQAVLCELLAAAIARMPHFKLVAQCLSGMEAVQACLTHEPDLLIIDVILPGMSGIEVVKMVHRAKPNIRIMAMTGMEDEELIQEMLKAGANGFVFKSAAFSVLSTAMNEVLAGRTYIHRIDGHRSITEMIKVGNNKQSLTTKEIEVLRLLARGLKAKEAADQLGCSVRTVDNHRANIMKKLNLHDIVSLTRYAIRRGFITP